MAVLGPRSKSAALLGQLTVCTFLDVVDTLWLNDPCSLGMFFYKNDNQESDIEILTVDLTQGAHYTNQNLNPAGGPSSTATKPLPGDATITMHEYRLDWHEGSTSFYLDGVLQQTISENVPDTPGAWLWNNWR